LIKLYNRYN